MPVQALAGPRNQPPEARIDLKKVLGELRVNARASAGATGDTTARRRLRAGAAKWRAIVTRLLMTLACASFVAHAATGAPIASPLALWTEEGDEGPEPTALDADKQGPEETPWVERRRSDRARILEPAPWLRRRPVRRTGLTGGEAAEELAQLDAALAVRAPRQQMTDEEAASSELCKSRKFLESGKRFSGLTFHSLSPQSTQGRASSPRP